MKKLVKVFALAALMIMGGQAMAQTHGTMFLGASFPMGDFGKSTGLYSTAIWGDATQTYGGAAIGFNAGLKWDFGVGVKGLAVILSLDGFYNGPNSDMKDAYKDVARNYDVLNNDIEQTTPKYINVPAMLGLRYTYVINPQLAVYAEAGAGGNARFITDYSLKYTDLLSIKHISTVSYNTAFSFAFQAGLGIEVSKSLVLGCSFYNLGSAPVKGEGVEKAGSVSTATDLEFGPLAPSMIVARVGFRF